MININRICGKPCGKLPRAAFFARLCGLTSGLHHSGAPLAPDRSAHYKRIAPGRLPAIYFRQIPPSNPTRMNHESHEGHEEHFLGAERPRAPTQILHALHVLHGSFEFDFWTPSKLV
jgi:hypothetical protein